jgi:hypothetical protein
LAASCRTPLSLVGFEVGVLQFMERSTWGERRDGRVPPRLYRLAEDFVRCVVDQIYLMRKARANAAVLGWQFQYGGWISQ